jgi:hypothetical protein
MTLRVHMPDMHKWVVYEDNVRFYDHIMKNNGVVNSLDYRGYVQLLTDFGINFTLPVGKAA